MSMRRFFYEGAAAVGEEITLNDKESHHIATVLRMQVAAQIIVVAAGSDFRAEIGAITDGKVRVRLLEQVASAEVSPCNIYLLQGLAKGERMDLVLQKSVELGVHAFISVPCVRSVVQLKADKTEKRLERWSKIAEEAAKQCGRTDLPQISAAANLTAALAELPADTLLLVAWEEERQQGLKQVLADFTGQNVAVLVGPEGGLTAEEVACAQAQGAVSVTLGRRILRTETAGIALVAILQYALGDLGGQQHD